MIADATVAVDVLDRRLRLSVVIRRCGESRPRDNRAWAQVSMLGE